MITYNNAEFVSDSILSVINQDYSNIQLVISDDASIDETPEIINSFQQKYPNKIIVNINKSNLGITKNTNLALKKCTGEFVTFLDGDDIFLPGKLNLQVKYMLKYPQYPLTYHDVEVFLSSTGKKIYNWRDRFIHKNISASTLVRLGPVIPSQSVMIKQSCLPNALDENIIIGFDWIVWIESMMNCKHEAGYLDLTLARYRRHTGNLTNSWSWKMKDQLTTLNIVENTWNELALECKQRKSEIYLISAIRNLVKREYRKAFHEAILMIKFAFPHFLVLLRLPIRELTFFFKLGAKFDDLMRSLFFKP